MSIKEGIRQILGLNDKLIKDYTEDEIIEALSIIDDLAHSGGPVPDSALLYNSRRRAENFKSKVYDRRRLDERNK